MLWAGCLPAPRLSPEVGFPENHRFQDGHTPAFAPDCIFHHQYAAARKRFRRSGGVTITETSDYYQCPKLLSRLFVPILLPI
jgi:hypothetical protein